MKSLRLITVGAMLACFVMGMATEVDAQTSNVVQDSFTGTSANLNWTPFNGACLTAGDGTGTVPACNGLSYYGSQTQAGLTGNADTAGSGALRLTNGCAGGSGGTCYFSQNGAIVSQTPFPSNQGIQVTFTTYTYSGNQGGGAQDGADGIGFYLINADKTPTQSVNGKTVYQPAIGSWGGSLGYSCSNTNPNYDGMLNGYIGLGMDEFGNYLNGAYTSGYTGDNTSTGQQATNNNGGNGQEYQPERIGLRGYGNINLATLQQYNSNATAQDVQNTCMNGGTYSYTNSYYTFTYSYPAGGNYTNRTVTKVSGSPIDRNPTSKNIQACSTLNSSTTTGGPGPSGGTPVAYGAAASQPLFQQSSTVATQSSTITKSVSYKSGTYSCSQKTTTATTTYTYTQQGQTVTTGSAANSNGYTGSGTPFGVDTSGNYYPISWSSTPQSNSLTQTLPDYAAIPNAFVNLPTSTPIASESATTRANATPISYKLQITQDGLLSLWYSYNGGNYTPVLTSQSISSSNGSMPNNFLFGFGGSTGGSDNVHEITCFQATPADLSASSAGINVQQTGQVQTGTQVYLAYYHPNNWWGELTSQNLVYNTATNTVAISSQANWDASCVLTGGNCTATNATGMTAQYSSTTGRTLMTWSGGPTNTPNSTPAGIPLTWGRLSAQEQAWLQGTDTLQVAQNRLAYLSGDRTNEINTSGTGEFRNRSSILGDIINSSPTWVGPPASPYPDTWKDLLYPTLSLNENVTGVQAYSTFASAEATRMNVVFDGANDGFMHAFRSGYYNADGTYAGTTDSGGNFTGTYNDGQELFAYMPEAVLAAIHNTSDPTLDYSSSHYAHNYYADSTPGTGDLFYGGKWHTWLVSGLGNGGNAIFALDITDLGNTSTSAAPGVGNVKGEWSTAVTTSGSATTVATTLTCYGDTTSSGCGSSLGQTLGTPQIRRLHNGQWAVIFGNGLNSYSGDAGIYVMTINGSGSPSTVYYLSTGKGTATTPNGIAYVTPVDLDGDHITDFVYAGDVYGNVWRFDLTSSDPTQWGVSTYGNASGTPLFTTPVTTYTDGTTGNQPITTQLVAVAVAESGTNTPYVLIEFGTGQVTPATPTTPIAYASGQQALYGIWDWYMGQAGTPGSSYTGLIGSSSAPTTTAPISLSQLQQQTVTSETSATGSGSGQGYRTVSNASICFVGTTCTTLSSSGTPTTTAGSQFGWYMNLPGHSSGTSVGENKQTEQVVFSPIESEGAFIVNTTIPANNSPLTCTVNSALGWTMGLSPATGGAFSQSFFASASGQFITVNGAPVSGIALNATGSPSVVTANNEPFMVNQTVTGAGIVNQLNPPTGSTGKRLTWLQLR
ncbi:PilC/PilY family type IV pilus protein [Dyella choica]|uniref:Pilus assembly protein PilY n=1 Tax=Dyella choica TaxID=1927959 RepID=A0A3S0R2V1_9GAMM|nr:PilC/PilY family type IV pilus protein [Dyella choica]RUL74041.1 pilus assembly protein PilY [Dyella choica]